MVALVRSFGTSGIKKQTAEMQQEVWPRIHQVAGVRCRSVPSSTKSVTMAETLSKSV